MVEDLDLILKTITTVARRYIKKAWPFGPQCDQIDFFFFGSETIFDVFRRFKSHVIISPPWLINFTGDSLWKEKKIAGTGRLGKAGGFNRRYPTCQISAILYSDGSDTPGDFRQVCPRSTYKIANCVTGFSISRTFRIPFQSMVTLVSRALLGFLSIPLLR